MSETKELTERKIIFQGIKRSNIVEISDEDLDEFTCKICSGLLVEPLMTKCCRQLFCKQCIEKYVSENNSCPDVVCKQKLNHGSLTPVPGSFVKLLGNLKVKCDYLDNGCTKVLRVKEFGQHIQVCELRPKENCNKCGLIKDHQSEHDCVQALINDRDEIVNHMKKRMEIKKKALQTEMIKIKSENNALQTEIVKIKLENNTLQNEINKFKPLNLCCRYCRHENGLKVMGHKPCGVHLQWQCMIL